MNNSRAKSDNLNVVGNVVQQLREDKNLSYQELSDKLMLYGIDISKMGLSRIEKGKRTVTDFELCGLSKVFNVSEVVAKFKTARCSRTKLLIEDIVAVVKPLPP